MTTIIDLLNEKNAHLERFYQLNETELANFTTGDFDNLDTFYRTREGLLDIIGKLDEMIAHEQTGIAEGQTVPAELRKSLIEALDFKNEIVVRILEQDLQILTAIETKKSNVIKEIAQVRSSRKAIGSYRSGTPDARLDEEA